MIAFNFGCFNYFCNVSLLCDFLQFLVYHYYYCCCRIKNFRQTPKFCITIWSKHLLFIFAIIIIFVINSCKMWCMSLKQCWQNHRQTSSIKNHLITNYNEFHPFASNRKRATMSVMCEENFAFIKLKYDFIHFS